MNSIKRKNTITTKRGERENGDKACHATCNGVPSKKIFMGKTRRKTRGRLRVRSLGEGSLTFASVEAGSITRATANTIASANRLADIPPREKLTWNDSSKEGATKQITRDEEEDIVVCV